MTVWPWEHLAVGYLSFSTVARGSYRRPPTRSEAIAVVIGTQFPDLIDKPLGWVLQVLPASGLSLGHSLVFAVPVIAMLLVLSRRYGHQSIAVGFGVGYLLHMPADVLYGVALGGDLSWRFLLWPLVPQEVVAQPDNTLVYVASLFRQFTAVLASPTGLRYVVLEVLLVGGCFVQWVRDGAPGLERSRS